MRGKSKKTTINNFVAKHAKSFCKATTHRDKKNDYKRNDKHRPNYKNYDGVSIMSVRFI